MSVKCKFLAGTGIILENSKVSYLENPGDTKRKGDILYQLVMFHSLGMLDGCGFVGGMDV